MTASNLEQEIKELIIALKKGKEAINKIKELFPKVVSDSFQRVDINKGGFRVESLNADTPYVGLINKDNPASGSYGGMSLVFFPNEEGELLVCFGIGTAGISPDEKILTRPGHRRKLIAIQKLFPMLWVKEDPADLSKGIPSELKKEFPEFSKVFRAYDTLLYSFYKIGSDEKKNVECFSHHLVLYGLERGWKPMKSTGFEDIASEIQGEWIENLFKNPTEEEILNLVKNRHYVILQGPPGTGKTYLSQKIAKEKFNSNFEVVQFHPNTSYESFIRGIRPQTKGESLKFSVAQGILDKVGNSDEDFLLIIDEINRADLSKVLGEAIFLLEPLEIKKNKERFVNTPYPKSGDFTTEDESEYQVKITDKLFILGTMNTSDRSIAILDFAIRRRFAFVDLWPDRSVIEKENSEEINKIALPAFDKVMNIFIEYANEEELNLMPGHSYFIAKDVSTLKIGLLHEVIPLLKEYLAEGHLSSFRDEILFVIDFLKRISS